MSTTIRQAWLVLPMALVMIAGCGGKPADKAVEAADSAMDSASQAADAAGDAAAMAGEAAGAAADVRESGGRPIPVALARPCRTLARRCRRTN